LLDTQYFETIPALCIISCWTCIHVIICLFLQQSLMGFFCNLWSVVMYKVWVISILLSCIILNNVLGLFQSATWTDAFNAPNSFPQFFNSYGICRLLSHIGVLHLRRNLINIWNTHCKTAFRCLFVFCKSRSEFILKSNGNKTISSWSVGDNFNAKLSDLGLDAAKYDLHSFRSGAASISANNHVSERLIQRHGRWRSSSSNDRTLC